MSITSAPTICPECNAEFQGVQPDRSTHFVCPKCKSYFVDAWEEDKRVIRTFTRSLSREMNIKAGTTGSLLAKRYTVAGAMRKAERNDSSVSWMEYLLYGENDTSAVLVEFEGEWLLVRPADEIPQPKSGSDDLSYKRGTYTPYHDYAADIISASGSFDYDILEDLGLHAWEYENGTHRLILEAREGAKGDWYIGMPLDGEMVADGLKIPHTSLPAKTYKSSRGPAANNPYREPLKWLYRIAFVAVAVIGLLQLGINYLHPSSELLRAGYTANTDSLTIAGTKPIASAAFHVQSRSELEVDLETPLENDWLEVNAIVVNDKTGQVFESLKSLEKYSGYEGGESWSEGNNSQDITFSSVPAGDYHINITAAGNPATINKDVPVRIVVRHQNWVMSNFVLVFLVVLSVPLIVQIQSNYYDNTH